MRTMTRRTVGILVLCLPALLGAPCPALAQASGTQVIVFGDSLSDPGNGFAFVKTSSTPPDYGVNALLIPDAPYATGGHHLSNGATWIEQLGAMLGAQRSVLPAFASADPYAMNFAISTARARDGVPPTLSFEVAAFLQKTGGQAPSDALYVIEIGAEDVRDAIATGDPAQALVILQAAAAAIASNISLLHSMGATNFLVLNVPDIGLTPAARLSGAAGAATLATQTFNGLLAAALAPLVASGVNIIPFDANAFVTSIVNNPALFGLTNVVDACITPDVPPFTCQAPDTYLFWDGIHPTAAAHALIAGAVALLLGV